MCYTHKSRKALLFIIEKKRHGVKLCKKKSKKRDYKLTKRQIKFCLFYMKDFDAKKAAIKAGLAKENDAEYVGSKLLLKKKYQRCD